MIQIDIERFYRFWDKNNIIGLAPDDQSLFLEQNPVRSNVDQFFVDQFIISNFVVSIRFQVTVNNMKTFNTNF